MKLFSTLLDLVYPPTCLLCGEFSEGEPLCPACLPRFEACRLSDRQLIEQTQLCCPHLDALTAPLLYRDAVRDLLLSLKERQDTRCQRLFAAEMAASLRTAELRADLIACVPTTPTKLRRRGFNHAAALAGAVAGELRLPLRRDLLTAADAGQAQHMLGRAARHQNASARFGPTSARLDGAAVLLIDDICTTGSTLEACTIALREMGAARVIACTAAITPLEHPDR